jgi:fido (protein-threonine AMPylation protein)
LAEILTDRFIRKLHKEMFADVWKFDSVKPPIDFASLLRDEFGNFPVE